MKKVFLLLFAIIVAFSANSQNEKSMRFGAIAGLNVSMYSTSIFNARAGFHIGGKMEMDIKPVYLETGLELSLKGSKIELLGTTKFNPLYLEIPIRVGYKYGIGKSFKVFGKFGPYLAFGLGGKEKFSFSDEDLDFQVKNAKSSNDDSSIKLFSDEGGMRRFDFGLGIHAGIEFKSKYQLAIGYDWGLIGIYKEVEDDIILGSDNYQNRNFKISLSYLF